MKLVIAGAGEVGRHLCAILSRDEHDVTVIEQSEAKAEAVDEEFNARALPGNGSSAETLIQAEADACDYFLAMTNDDTTNLVSASLAKALGAKTTIARIHDQTYTDTSFINYQLHFGIDFLLNPEALCAVELAKNIRNPGRVAVENFARGQIEVQQVRVSEESKLAGKSLRDLKLTQQMRVGFVQRGNSLEVATAETVPQAGDFVTLVGAPKALYEVRALLDPGSAVNLIRVVISGGGETAIALVRLLANPRFKIRVIEKDPAVCRRLAEKFSHITVINGDATSLRLMEEEQIGSCDYFSACTKKDEDNILTAVQASKLGARHVHALINKSDYDNVLEGLKNPLGVELFVSPRLATACEVLRYISAGPYVELAKLPKGVGSIIEIPVAPGSPCANRTIQEIALPPGTVVAALLHKFQAKVATAGDVILPQDRIVVITREENIKPLLQLFGGG